MKQMLRFCWKVMPMLLLGFVCIFSYPMNVQAESTLTLEEAAAKKAYWSGMGFPQYDPKAEGYKIVLNSEQRNERLKALAQFAEQKDILPAKIEAYRGTDWNRYFSATEKLAREAGRLDLDVRQLIDFLNGLEKLFNGNQFGFGVDCSEPSAEADKIFSLTQGAKVSDLINAPSLEVWWEILHVPVLGCVV